MTHDFTDIFNRLEPAEVPHGLLDAVLNRISRVQLRRTLVHAAVFGVIGLGAAAGVFVGIRSVISEFMASGFGQYLALLFSDTRVVLSNWQEYGLSLAEAIPATAVATVFAAAFALLLSVRFVTSDMSALMHRHHPHSLK